MKIKLFRISTVPISLNSLLKGQLEFLNNYFEVTAISGKGADLDEVRNRERVNIYPIEMQRQISPFKDFVSLIKLYRYFKRERPDVIHSITPKAGLLSMLAGKLAGVPVRMHTFTGLIFPYKSGLMQKILILMDKVLCYCATNIYPEGQGVKNDLKKFRITDKPLKIIGNGNVNGIDSTYFDPALISENDKKELRKSLGIGESDFIYVFVGRIVKDKGINELVEAFTDIDKKNQNTKLILVGTFERKLDPISQETESLITTNPNIITVGYQKDIRPYLGIADLFVFPSYREGFPNVLLQAGALGLPSIATDISGCNEIIRDGINGYIVPSKNHKDLQDKMQKLLQDPQLRQQMAERSRGLIIQNYEREFLWNEILKEYNTLLEK
ncbi:glycosyltransferase involved in cell wall biosynthesis [Epilithonimonas hungarica]|uniref:glycosyltransferase family 4 protein n=1 Tax=Epilithonimonas hungarica TaxID=454006 RepID=UPI00277F8E9F|nr:glycosyltransferase family 4 protein [Epilithonimonas hungarica]MDP9956818.1 glycosyltransferase involved in cell wall biosynthesis [Epilithonimonas hungarica]